MRVKILRTLLIGVFFSIISMIGVRSALAVPVLQLYIDGAAFDPSTETWVSTESTFDLWVIGAVDKNTARFEESDGSYTGNIIKDVTLAMAFTGSGGTITLTPATTGILSDPSTPGAPVSYESSGALALENPPLAKHGIYPSVWENYSLGDFTLEDSPVGDFADPGTGYVFPTSFPNSGQINVYKVAVTGWESVHFDAFAPLSYGAVPADGPGAYHIAPYSHDAGYNVVPEPGTYILLGSGLLGLFFLRKKLKKA
ncbi:hypothetical protein MNBD_DELTA01-858 [hydrothermal vent metagenome]|uniref:Ice-binding protein C-terminal domain-containing protein n=1 Tax=hydrothermal vent metagenome TaxID=652676 RepID=A0A3B0QU76_9ZZZZ